MASADITLKLDHEDRISFAHSPSSAFIFTLVSLDFTWVCWNFIRHEPAVRMFIVAFPLLFVLVGLIAARGQLP